MILGSMPEMFDEDIISFIGSGCAVRFLLEAILIFKQKMAIPFLFFKLYWSRWRDVSG